MPKSESSRIEALEALLAERRRHEGYLAKLEERRASTPAHVYTRLRDEYLTKLTDLQVRAAAEAESLSGGIEEDEAVVAEIESRLGAALEERIEGELRADVGEYEPKEWSKKLTVLNATISQLEKERDARAGAFERRRELLRDALNGTSASAVKEPDTAPRPGVVGDASDEAAPAKIGEPAAPAAEAESSSAGAGPPSGQAAAPAARMSGGPSFDELAFLNSVVGRASTPPPPAPSRAPTPVKPQAPSEPPAAPAAPATPAAETLAPLPTAGPISEGPSAPIKEPPSGPRAGSAGRAEPSFTAPPASADDEPPSPLGRPTPRTSQAIKTLKCQECGTLNYPTEWYCERCGGELAAL